MSEVAVAAPPTRRQPDQRVAIVHDFVVERGGAERVLLELNRTFPATPIHTALFDPQGTYAPLRSLDMHTLVGRGRPPGPLLREHRRSLPLAVRAFRNTTIDADVLIANSSGLSHLTRCTGRRLVYCQTPARWLHAPDDYLRHLPAITVRAFSVAIRRWLLEIDREAMRSADAVLVNSHYMANVVEAIYDIDVEVVRPPSSLFVDGPTAPIPGLDPGFFLTPSRLLGYKRLDVLLHAAESLPDEQFLVVGDGPLRRSLSRSAPPNVVFAGSVSEATLRWAYDACKAVVLTCADDYGLVPREAAAFGKGAVTPSAGGYLEQSTDGLGTVAYSYGSWQSLRAAIRPLVECGRPLLVPVCDLDADRAAFGERMTGIIAGLGDRP